MNQNDLIRAQMLRYLYDRNHSATSRRGKKGSAVMIKQMRSDLKAQFGLTQQQVMSNLTYLIDKGWVNTHVIEKTVVVRGGTIPSTSTYYEISAPGIDKIEGESEFQREELERAISITAGGNTVVTVGNNNRVRVKHEILYTQLDQLEAAVHRSHLVVGDQLSNFSQDLSALKEELHKPAPRTPIVRRLWESIEATVTLAGLADALAKVSPYIGALLQ